jgi:hypothetical protein
MVPLQTLTELLRIPAAVVSVEHLSLEVTSVIVSALFLPEQQSARLYFDRKAQLKLSRPYRA